MAGVIFWYFLGGVWEGSWGDVCYRGPLEAPVGFALPHTYVPRWLFLLGEKQKQCSQYVWGKGYDHTQHSFVRPKHVRASPHVRSTLVVFVLKKGSTSHSTCGERDTAKRNTVWCDPSLFALPHTYVQQWLFALCKKETSFTVRVRKGTRPNATQFGVTQTCSRFPTRTFNVACFCFEKNKPFSQYVWGRGHGQTQHSVARTQTCVALPHTYVENWLFRF